MSFSSAAASFLKTCLSTFFIKRKKKSSQQHEYEAKTRLARHYIKQHNREKSNNKTKLQIQPLLNEIWQCRIPDSDPNQALIFDADCKLRGMGWRVVEDPAILLLPDQQVDENQESIEAFMMIFVQQLASSEPPVGEFHATLWSELREPGRPKNSEPDFTAIRAEK